MIENIVLPEGMLTLSTGAVVGSEAISSKPPEIGCAEPTSAAHWPMSNFSDPDI
jgi:hypothetical protein